MLLTAVGTLIFKVIVMKTATQHLLFTSKKAWCNGENLPVVYRSKVSRDRLQNLQAGIYVCSGRFNVRAEFVGVQDLSSCRPATPVELNRPCETGP